MSDPELHPRSTAEPLPPAPAGGDPDLARWDARYAGADGLFGLQPNAFLAAQQPRLRPGMSALCIGDGDGRNSRWLAAQGLAVTAFDFSPVALSQARKRAEAAGVQVDYRQCRLEDWHWLPAAYDVIAAIFVQFATPPQRARMFAGIVHSLRPGGVLLLQGYRPPQLAYRTGGPPQVEQLYTEPMLREAFGALTLLELRSHDSVIDEGVGHSGMSALVDLIAMKPASDAAPQEGRR